jgi:hypothetical protein
VEALSQLGDLASLSDQGRLVSRELVDLVTGQADEELVFPLERTAATFWSTPSSSSTNSTNSSAIPHHRCWTG